MRPYIVRWTSLDGHPQSQGFWTREAATRLLNTLILDHGLSARLHCSTPFGRPLRPSPADILARL